MRPEYPDHVNAREAPPEASHRSQSRPRDLPKPPEVLVVRQQLNPDARREEETIVDGGCSSRPREQEQRLELAANLAGERQEWEVGGIGSNPEPVRCLNQPVRTVDIEAEPASRGSHSRE